MTKSYAILHLVILIGGFVLTWNTGNPWWAVGGYCLFTMLPTKGQSHDQKANG